MQVLKIARAPARGEKCARQRAHTKQRPARLTRWCARRRALNWRARKATDVRGMHIERARTKRSVRATYSVTTCVQHRQATLYLMLARAGAHASAKNSTRAGAHTKDRPRAQRDGGCTPARAHLVSAHTKQQTCVARTLSVGTKRSVRAGARKAENFMRERQPATHRDHVLRQHVCVSIISTAKPPSVPKRLSERQFICARCARAGAH